MAPALGAREHLVITVVLASASVACAETEGSRQLAVTVTDSAEIECVGISNSAALEQPTMDSIAKDVERLWEDEQKREPPTPEGRVMRVNETELGMQAWFDPHPASNPALDPERFDNPLVVYAGELHDDYIEGVYRDVFNTDKEDEDAGREKCGDRVRVSGTLSLTDAKGILGRIRWQEHAYVDSVTSACAGRIECVRDIAIEGLELE